MRTSENYYQSWKLQETLPELTSSQLRTATSNSTTRLNDQLCMNLAHLCGFIIRTRQKAILQSCVGNMRARIMWLTALTKTPMNYAIRKLTRSIQVLFT